MPYFNSVCFFSVCIHEGYLRGNFCCYVDCCLRFNGFCDRLCIVTLSAESNSACTEHQIWKNFVFFALVRASFGRQLKLNCEGNVVCVYQ